MQDAIKLKLSTMASSMRPVEKGGGEAHAVDKRKAGNGDVGQNRCKQSERPQGKFLEG